MANYDGDITLTVDLEPGDIQSVTEDLQERIKDIVRNPGGMQVTKGFKQLQTTMVKATERADDLLKRMHELEGLEFKTEAYQELSDQLEEINAEADKIKDLRNTAINLGFDDRAISAYDSQLDELILKIVELKEEMFRMDEAGEAWTPGEETQEYANLTQQLNSLNNQMTVSVERADSMGAAMGRVPEALNTARTFFTNLGTAIARVFSLFSNLGPLLRTVASRLVQVANNAARAATNLLRMAGSSIVKGIRSLTGHLGKLVSSLRKTNKSTDSASDAFRKGLKTLIKYTFGVRSFFFLWRKMRKALSEGIGNLAQYSAPFNDIISDFISALTRLKNSFATAFAPIMNVVVPILTTFINVVSDVVTKIGMLIAALTGQTTFIRAKAVQEDYAASLDKAAGSASDAAKANKEYEKTIAGFDDVEILKDPTKNASGSGGSGGSGGAGGISPEDMFETVNIPSAFHDWAAKIKEAWEQADFTELGEVLGGKIANILNNLPWDDIQQNAQNFGQSFATFVNGVISVDGLATTVGSTIGEAINTGLSLWEGFIEPFDFDALGAFIGETMNGMVITTDWDKLASDITATANGVFRLASTWADEFDFDALGDEIEKTITKTLKGIKWEDAEEAVGKIASKIASALNKIMTEDTFKSVGKAIGSGINMAVTGVTNFVSGIKWDNWGKNLAAGVNSFFDTVDWEKLKVSFDVVAEALAKGIKAACKVTNTFLNNISWDDVAKTLASSVNTFFKTLDWEELKITFNSAAKALAGGIKTACAITNTFLDGIKWDNVATTLSSSVNIFFNKLSWEELEVTFNNVARAIANGIKTGVSTAHTFITDLKWDEVGKIVGTSANTFFETVNWAEIGVTFGAIAKGVAKFIKEAIETINFKTVGEDVATAFTSVPWDELFKQAGELVEASAEALGQFLDGLLSKLGEALTNWFDEHLPQEIKDFIDKVITAYTILTTTDWGVEGVGDAYDKGSIKETGEVPESGDFEYHGIAMGIVRAIQQLLNGEEGELDVTVNATGMNDKIPTDQKDVNGKLSATEFNDKMAAQQKVVNNVIANLTSLNKNTIPSTEKTVSGMSGDVTKLNRDSVPASEKTVFGILAYIKSYSEASGVTGKSPSDFWAHVTKYLEAPGITGKSPQNFIAWIKNYKEQQGATGKETTGVSAGINKFFEQPKATGKSTNGYSAGVSSFSEEDKATGKTSKGWKAVASKLTDSIAKKNKVIKNATVKATDLNTKSVDGDTVNVTAKATDLNTKKVDGDYVDVTAKVTQLEGLRSKIVDIFEAFGLKVGKKTGGVFYGGAWHGIAQYATGGSPTHGTVFVAGEAGAEAVGHIGNRTEVLNQSQMAAVMYSAVLNGTASLVKTITNYMALCTNTLITNIGTIISQAGYISSQLAELHNLGNILTTTLTDIVVGKIIPSTYTNNANNNTLNKILDVLQYNQSNMVTRDELEVVLRTSFERYMNIGFYIGDEQIARHANAGNAKLNYRFSPVR